MSTLKSFREVVGDRESDALTAPISSEGGTGDDREVGDANQKRKADYAKKLADLEKRLAALELRIGDLPSAAARTAEQFCQKITGRLTESQRRESRDFCKHITAKGCK